MIPFLVETEDSFEVVLIILSALSVCLSLLATIILKKCRRIPISIKFLVFNTELMEFLKGMILIIYITTEGSSHCVIQDHILYVLHVSAVLQLALMGLDRVVLIYNPRFYHDFFTKRTILVICLLMWIIVFALSAYGYIHKVDNKDCYILTENKQIHIAALLASVLIFSFLLSTISLFILFKKVLSLKNRAVGSTNEIQRSYKGHVVIATMQLCMLVLTTPCAVSLILLSLDKETRISLDFTLNKTVRITSVCITLSGILIPFVYVFRLTECQIRLLEILCSWNSTLNDKASVMDVRLRMNMAGIPLTRNGQIGPVQQ